MADKKGAKVEKASGALGSDEVQAAMDEEQEQGYSGVKVDPTPNEAYTVKGVTAGAPTPETDKALEEEARKAAGIGGGPLTSAETAKNRASDDGEPK